tara:strand:+ start:12522 stop:15191 length:2670 start_codon:yes stop_codon:yes gene_type:complete
MTSLSSEKRISLDLMSGSDDGIRTALGGFYFETSSSSGRTFTFEPYVQKRPANKHISQARYRISDEYLQAVDSSTLMPNKKFPVRIYGSSENVLDDKHWHTLFYGGTYKENTYQPFYNENRHESINLSVSKPVAFPESSALTQLGLVSDSIACSYKINRYNSDYYAFVASRRSEMLLPNCYFLSDMSTYDIYDKDSEKFNSNLINLVTCENKYQDIGSLFTSNVREMRADLGAFMNAKKLEMLTTSKQGYEYSFLNTTYMSAALPQTTLSTETLNYARSRQRNILFDNNAIDKFYKSSQISENMEYFPYYININFPLDDVDENYQSIKDNNFSSFFIKSLFAIFSAYGAKNEAIMPESTKLAISSEGYNITYGSSISDSTAQYGQATSVNNVKTYDFVKFLDYCKNMTTNSPGLPGYMFAGENNAYRVAASREYQTKDINVPTGDRYIKSVTAGGVLSDLITSISASEDYSPSSIEDIFTDTESQSETIAYRIRKDSLSSESDSAVEQGFIQNYWFMNSDIEEFNFYDTQVNYNVSYQYSVYAYKIVKGYAYKYSNLLLTRQLNCDIEESYGLEFYNASTGERADQLYDLQGGRIQRLNDYSTMAQVTSEYPFLADMYMEIEPFVRIVEEPIFTKNIRVTDHWPPKVFARPYQVLDGSQKIGFEMRILGHESAAYTQTFDEASYDSNANYYDHNNLLPDEKVTAESVSEVKTIDIYRLAKKPTSLMDFQDNLLATVDLSLQESKYAYKTSFFENIINTNQKYYYAFRARNELGVAGHFSDIYETQLVDDGGYIYKIFNTYRESQLAEKTESTTTEPIRKLLQIRPQLDHITLVQDELNFNAEASSQVDNLQIGTADSPVWDKTFKFRLTSKKTGKKIDLNITYKLESEY